MDPKTPSFTVLTYNCLNPAWLYPEYYGGASPFHDSKRRFEMIRKTLCASNADVIMLQEVCPGLIDLLIDEVSLGFVYDHYHEYRTNGKANDMQLIFYKRDTWSFNSSDCNKDSKSPILFVDLTHRSTKQNVVFASVHLAGSQLAGAERVEAVHKALSKYALKNLIVAGDFNVTKDDPLYNLMVTGVQNELEYPVDIVENGVNKSVFLNIPHTSFPFDQKIKQYVSFEDLTRSPISAILDSETSAVVESRLWEGPDWTFCTKLIPPKVCDFVFGTKNVFKPKKLISPKEGMVAPEGGLPNEEQPSDHLPLHVEIEFAW